jgi:hypothetical protein
MASNDDLIPVFMPSLAESLARAAAVKGSRLTESEIVRIRDAAPCIMMEPSDAEKLVESRGYRDVEPENCWADWHRLRAQMTGDGYLPKIVLCLLGDDEWARRAEPLLTAQRIEHEWSERDKRMPKAFEASACRFDPSFEAKDLADIAEHTKVLYVLSKNFTAQEGPSVAASFLRLLGELLEAGAVAAKCESSGIAHGRARWLELAREAKGDRSWSALLRAYVQLPIQDGDDYYSCGLHLLGKPDLIVSNSLLRQAYKSRKEMGGMTVDLFGVFALYLLAECSEGQFFSGHTFSISSEAPRFRIVWEACRGYDEDDFFFNEFGRWRFAEVVSRT